MYWMGSTSLWEGAIFRGTIANYRDTLRSSVPFGFLGLDRPKESFIRWGYRSTMGRGNNCIVPYVTLHRELCKNS